MFFCDCTYLAVRHSFVKSSQLLIVEVLTAKVRVIPFEFTRIDNNLTKYPSEPFDSAQFLPVS